MNSRPSAYEIECHKQSLCISAGLKDNFAAAAAIHNLRDAYRLQKDFARAISMGMRSLHIFDCINSPQVDTAMMTLSKIAKVRVRKYSRNHSSFSRYNSGRSEN